MKYKIIEYAKALAEILSDKDFNEKQIIQGFLRVLERQSDIKKAKEIITATKILLAKKIGKKSVFFESARKLSDGQKKMLSKFVEEGDIVEEKINKELIAGVKIIIDNEKQLDQTILTKINNIF